MDEAEFSDLHLQIRRACHDLNAPIRAAHGFADILQRREAANLSDRGRLYLRRMGAAVDHMEQIVDGLHRYARLATHTRQTERIAVAKLLREEVRRHFAVPEKQRRLHWEAEDGLEWAGDRELLQIIIHALVHNALRFVAPETEPHVLISCQKTPDGGVRIRVRDNGIGIESGQRQRVFRLFERLHNRDHYNGAGTGLALVWKATQVLGGTIAVGENLDDGGGTVVEITLPSRANGQEGLS